MKLTRSALAGFYEGLRHLPPFNRYKLPQPHLVKFRVSKSKMLMGSYEIGCDGHELTISSELHKKITEAVETLAHEMVHMCLERKGCADHSEHDAEFNQLAAEVCNEQGFKFPTF